MWPGADEEKEELAGDCGVPQKPAAKFNTLGARIPHGVLLVGPPGTGKTLLARAVCGRGGRAVLSPSPALTLWRCMWAWALPVCATCFEKAKKTAPCIVFIDEIDAVGRQRGAGLGGGHDEREQTLNQLLVEMDGFAANEGVIVIAATNRADILDKALLRPGRFDRQVYVGLPDIKGREEILQGAHAQQAARRRTWYSRPLPNPPPASRAPTWRTLSTRRRCLQRSAGARPSPSRTSRRPASRWWPAPKKRAAS